MERIQNGEGIATKPTTSVALPVVSTARFHHPNSLHGETELTVIPTLDEEQTGSDHTALLSGADGVSSVPQPSLPNAPRLDGTKQGEVDVPASSNVRERGTDFGNARLQLKWPKWLFKGQGWEGAFPLKWCVAAASFGLAMDQNLMAPNLSAIALDFHMDPTERDRKLGGQVAFAFFLVGAPAALGIGFAADRVASRRDLLAATTFIGAIATMGSGLSPNFTCLFWTRALAGGAVGGMMPLCLSLLADLYGPHERTVATSLLAMASGIGTGTGQNLGGVLGPWFGWRCPFIVSSLPAIAVAAVIFWFTADPARGAMDADGEKEEDVEGYHEPTIDPTTTTTTTTGTSDFPGGGDSSSGENSRGSVGISSSSSIFTTRSSHVERKKNEIIPCGSSLTVQSPMHVKHSSLLTSDIDDTSGSLRKDEGNEEIGEEINLDNEDDDEVDMLDEEVDDSNCEVEMESMASKGRPPDLVADLRILFRTPSVLLAYAQGGPGCVPWGIVGVFLNDYLAQDKGLGVTASTGVQGALGIGGLLGTWLGGHWGQKAYNYSGTHALMPLFMGTAAALGAFPFWLLLNLPKGELMKQATDDLGNDDDYNSNDGDGSSNSGGSSSSSSSSSSGGGSDYSSAGNSGSGALGGGVSWSLFMVYALTAFVTGITICMTGNCVRSMVQNTTLPHTRGAAFALFNLSDDLGRGLGPLAVAALIESFGGRQQAFNVATTGWLICGLLNMVAAFTIDRDVDAVVLWVNQQAAQPSSSSSSSLGASSSNLGRGGIGRNRRTRRRKGDKSGIAFESAFDDEASL